MTPCKACVERGFHCCNRLPLFKNRELAKILDDKVLENLGMRIKIIRYQREVYTCVNLDEDEGIQVKESREGKRDCIFLGEEGCKLGEYMPEYCKLIRECNSNIACAFCNISNDEFAKMSDDEINKIFLTKSKPFINYDIAYSKLFQNELTQKANISKKLKFVKDELFFYMVFYLLINNSKFLLEKGIAQMELIPKIFLDNTDILVTKDILFKVITENPELKLFFKKLTNIANFTISSYSPEKQTIIENKLTGILNGVHNAKEEYLKGYKGLLLAVLLLYFYKEKFKMKNSRFKGVLSYKEFARLGDSILEKMEEEYEPEEIDKIFEEINQFAESLFKKIVKEKI